VVQKPIQDGRGDNQIPEHRRLPPFSMGWCLMSQ
jgi:hypothetical protein